MAKEIRVTFTDKEEDLYNYVFEKSSKTAFLKDLAAIEKKREENYINASLENHLDKIVEKLISKLGNIDLKQEDHKDNEDKNKEEYDFNIDDILKK
jgi:hypothetical protein